jgi:hypothetical protein
VYACTACARIGTNIYIYTVCTSYSYSTVLVPQKKQKKSCCLSPSLSRVTFWLNQTGLHLTTMFKRSPILSGLLLMVFISRAVSGNDYVLRWASSGGGWRSMVVSNRRGCTLRIYLLKVASSFFFDRLTMDMRALLRKQVSFPLRILSLPRYPALLVPPGTFR